MDQKTIIVQQGSVSSFLRGVAVGAAIALLFAPRSGRETREMISEKGIDIKDMAVEKGLEIKDRAVDMARDTRDRAQTMVSDARSKFGESVKRAADSADVSKSQLKRELAISEDIENPEYPL